MWLPTDDPLVHRCPCTLLRFRDANPKAWTYYGFSLDGPRTSGKVPPCTVLIKPKRQAQACARPCATEEEKAPEAGARVRLSPTLTKRQGRRALEKVWFDALCGVFPGVTFAKWDPKDLRQVHVLMGKYPQEILKQAILYLMKEWPARNRRFFRGEGSVPTVGFLLKFHDTLVPESQIKSLAAAAFGTSEP